jgi:folate-binding protein YgfZ
MTTSALLEDRGVIRVRGDDATSFLQGLLTNDVERLGAGEARYAGLLSPQGKILFDMLVLRAPTGSSEATYLMDCSASHAPELAKRLGFYRLRSKVAIADESPSRCVVAFWGEEPDATQDAVVYRDPRDARLGWRAIMPRDKALAGAEAHGAYEAIRISAGVPKGGVDFVYGDAFPHDANFDLLHGVDFEKGCYVGQEVVSRMMHRGTARKRIVPVKLSGEPPAPGTPVFDRELMVGTLGSSSGRDALAMLRLDRVEEAKAAGRMLTAGGVGLEPAE